MAKTATVKKTQQESNKNKKQKVEAAVGKVKETRKKKTVSNSNEKKSQKREGKKPCQPRHFEEHLSCQKNGDVITLTPLTDYGRQLILNIQKTPTDEDPDPVVVFSWNFSNIVAALTLLNAAHVAGTPIPAWFGIHNGAFPMSINQLQHGILCRIHTSSGTLGNIISNFAIAPNTVYEYANIKTQCYGLALDPFWGPLNAAHLPLANMYSVLDRKQATTATSDPVQLPPAPFPTIIN
jgi:hypothetical protein